jgi:outer membrane protein assembly factor BamA
VKQRFGVALASGIEFSRFTDVSGTDFFQQTYGSTIEDTDITGRLTLLYDSRDNEFNTRRGVFVEGSGLVGSGGNGYQRLTFIARGYLPVRTGTIIAARLGASGVLGEAPLSARYEIPTWEHEVSVYGGEFSNRGVDDQRYAGEHVLFGNLEIRHDLLNAGDYGAITLLAFVDAGRVFEGEHFRLTTEHLKVGKGGGLALRLLRSTILTFNFADGPDGFEFSGGSGWMF